MNRYRWVVTLVISVLMGAVAVGLASAWLGQRASLATTKVVVVTRDIEIGSTLQRDHVTETDWPTESAPKDKFDELDKVVGRVVKSTLYRGEPVIEAKLSPAGAKGGLSSIITPGKRAVTVRVNDVIGVSGFALPGNYVDILVHTRDSKGQEVSKFVLERVMVLAVAQEADRDETKPKVVNAVTLELSPEQVEVLDLARSVGQLSLVLRNQFESDPVATGGARRDNLFGQIDGPGRTAAQPAAPAGAPVTVASAAGATAPRPAPRPRPRPAAEGAAASTASDSPRMSNAPVEVIRGVTRTTAEFGRQ